ncbi:hypothetical protein VTN31DRAFT_6864 [Thermomyces dupontii]|uniref:uncharacterized protein n=1 Tax=Talaromyces thermophilus TaxID=28565 RepID=UPI003743E7FB
MPNCRLTFVGVVCAGEVDGDVTNLDNFVASCGLVYGAPNRVDNKSSSTVFEPGSNWSIQLYSGIMTVGAKFKKGWHPDSAEPMICLPSRSLKSTTESTQARSLTKPLWEVECCDRKLNDARLLWGLISSPGQGNISLHLRQESLYFPGYDDGFGSFSTVAYQNLWEGGPEFYSRGIGSAFSMKYFPSVP